MRSVYCGINFRFLRNCVVLLSLCGNALLGDDEHRVQLTLPPQIFAVPNVETNVYLSNIVLLDDVSGHTFEVECSLGTSESGRWTLNASESDVGSVPLTVTVRGPSGTVIESAATTVTVVTADAGRDRDIRLLIVGDSLTHASAYPNEMARLLDLPGNPTWKMLGTHKPAGAAKGVAHEGYGGWTWAAFNSRYSADDSRPGNSSPFVFLNAEEKPVLNVDRYFKERCDRMLPDFIIVKLGINDCFGFNADDRVKLDSQIDGVFAEAEKLLSEFRKTAPSADIGICLTTPGNSRDEAFVANYQDKYSRSGWKKIQHRLVQRQIDSFGGRESQRMFLIPTEVNLDVVDGYPANNAVHPNAHGYEQIGQTIHSWLKWRMSERK